MFVTSIFLMVEYISFLAESINIVWNAPLTGSLLHPFKPNCWAVSDIKSKAWKQRKNMIHTNSQSLSILVCLTQEQWAHWIILIQILELWYTAPILRMHKPHYDQLPLCGKEWDNWQSAPLGWGCHTLTCRTSWLPPLPDPAWIDERWSWSAFLHRLPLMPPACYRHGYSVGSVLENS